MSEPIPFLGPKPKRELTEAQKAARGVKTPARDAQRAISRALFLALGDPLHHQLYVLEQALRKLRQTYPEEDFTAETQAVQNLFVLDGRRREAHNRMLSYFTQINRLFALKAQARAEKRKGKGHR